MHTILTVIVSVQILLALIVTGLFWAVYSDKLPPLPPVPEVPEKWFGSGQRTKEDPAVRPFAVKIEDGVREITPLKTLSG